MPAASPGLTRILNRVGVNTFAPERNRLQPRPKSLSLALPPSTSTAWVHCAGERPVATPPRKGGAGSPPPSFAPLFVETRGQRDGICIRESVLVHYYYVYIYIDNPSYHTTHTAQAERRAQVIFLSGLRVLAQQNMAAPAASPEWLPPLAGAASPPLPPPQSAKRGKQVKG